MWHFLQHSFCLLVLRNNDGAKVSLDFLFPLYAIFTVFGAKISSICWLLYKIGT